MNKSGLYHIYLRALDKGLIFYTLEDRLVYYTICAVKAKECNVRIAAAAIMFTHVHFSAQASVEDNIGKFLQKSGTSFSRLYNFRHGRSGRLFDRPPGQSFKATSKEKRSNVIYVFNNHVEKGLCKDATKERWSFLAYAGNRCPFSSPVGGDGAGGKGVSGKNDGGKNDGGKGVSGKNDGGKGVGKESARRRGALGKLLKASRLIDRRVAKLKPLEYCDLDGILPYLSDDEREQFIDYVISKYALIDFSIAGQMFGGIDALKLAAESTTGGEYDIKEEYERRSDTAYAELVKLADAQGFVNNIFKMCTAEKLKWIEYCVRTTSASFAQLRKFFHENFKTS